MTNAKSWSQTHNILSTWYVLACCHTEHPSVSNTLWFQSIWKQIQSARTQAAQLQTGEEVCVWVCAFVCIFILELHNSNRWTPRCFLICFNVHKSLYTGRRAELCHVSELFLQPRWHNVTWNFWISHHSRTQVLTRTKKLFMVSLTML